MTKKDEVIQLLDACTEEERLEIFHYLRKTIPIHAIEAKLNTQAEVILEAIDRAGDLTLRGIRGIIAEAAFLVEVLGKLEGWKDVTPPGDAAYDFLIEDTLGRISIEVKMQRKERGEPKVKRGYMLWKRSVPEAERTAPPAWPPGHTVSVSSISLRSLCILQLTTGIHSCTR